MPRPLLTHAELRERIDLYLNAAERSAIEAKARDAGLAVSAFIRKAALGQRIEVPQVVNAARWGELARTTANLNQLAHAVNAGHASGIDPRLIEELADQVRLLRLELLGSQGTGK